MAITTFTPARSAPVVGNPPGARRKVYVNLTGDSAYPTNGSTIDPKLFGMVQIDHVQASLNTAGSHLYVWDSVNAKLKGYSALTTEIGNGVDVSAHIIPATITGV